MRIGPHQVVQKYNAYDIWLRLDFLCTVLGKRYAPSYIPHYWRLIFENISALYWRLTLGV